MKNAVKLAIFTVLICHLTGASALAQWPITPDQRLWLGYGTETKCVSDGNGGIFTIFTANSGLDQSNCYLQKTDQLGYRILEYPLHLESGIGLEVIDFEAITDDQGGIIVGLLERCGTDPEWSWRLSLYHLDSNAEIVYWNKTINNGGQVAGQDYFVMTSDHQGGCYVACMSTNFVVQRINFEGNKLWGDEGLELSVGSAYPAPYDLTVGSDSDNCYLTVRGSALYAFKFSSDGSSVWPDYGIEITDLGEDTELVPDDEGGFVEICRTPNQNELLVYRVDENGNCVWNQGVSLGSIYWDKSILCHYPYIYVNWLSGSSIHQAQLQKFDLDGNILWAENKNLFVGSELQDDPQITEADDGGLIFICKRHNGINFDIFGQKLDYDGNYLWNPSGVALTTRGLYTSSLCLKSTGSGGGVFNWYEIDPDSSQMVCVAMVNQNGVLGEVLGVDPWQETPIYPKMLKLDVYPNPANPDFTISCQIQKPGNISLQIFNSLGQLVLMNEYFKNPGTYQWQPILSAGLASGNYLIVLRTADAQSTKRVSIIK